MTGTEGQTKLRSAVHRACYPVPPRIRNYLVWTVALFMAAFQLYTGCVGSYTSMIQCGIHLSCVMGLIFLTYPTRKGTEDSGLSLIDLLLFLVAVFPGFYLTLNYADIIDRGSIPNEFEVILGLVVIVQLLEAVRRVMGLPLAIIAVVALLYCYFGPYFPGMLANRGYSLARISSQMFMSESGIMGAPLIVCSTVIALFIMFGAFLEQSGGTGFFIDVAMSLTRGTYGGPAKAAVVASGLMGTISGSAVANVVTTGTLTIPLMIKTGYRRAFAGAVEAVSSSGGQLAPPIMGAAAFLMADMTGLSYSRIALAAVIPALLYYVSLYFFVHLEARRLKLKSTDTAVGRPTGGWHLFLPVIMLITLMSLELSPMYVAFWTIVCLVAISWFSPATRLSPRKILRAMINGSLSMLTVSTACATAGIVVGAAALTGLPLKFSSMLVAVADGNLLILLGLTMASSLIMGMGLPTAPAYILLATLVAPALTELGIHVLAAHLFIFYYGVISAITPPVAVASYAASSIAEAPPTRVSWEACRIGIVTFIIPYMFVYGPSLLFVGDWTATLQSSCTALVGVFALAVAFVGFWRCQCTLLERIGTGAAALLLITPEGFSDIAGIVLLLVLGALHLHRAKHHSGEPV